jgi:hypothetical protein
MAPSITTMRSCSSAVNAGVASGRNDWFTRIPSQR